MTQRVTIKQGTIVMVNLSPTEGREQAGWRPVLIVSNARFEHYTHLYKVVPITSQFKKFPLHVDLPQEAETIGQVLTQHERTLDLDARDWRYVEQAPQELVDKVLDYIRATY